MRDHTKLLKQCGGCSSRKKFRILKGPNKGKIVVGSSAASVFRRLFRGFRNLLTPITKFITDKATQALQYGKQQAKEHGPALIDQAAKLALENAGPAVDAISSKLKIPKNITNKAKELGKPVLDSGADQLSAEMKKVLLSALGSAATCDNRKKKRNKKRNPNLTAPRQTGSGIYQF